MGPSLILSALLAAPVYDAPAAVKLSGGIRSEEKLRRFVERDEVFKNRIADAVQREEILLADARETDLRDSVSDQNGNRLQTAFDRTLTTSRSTVSSLPGMTPSATPVCRTIVDCPVPDLTLDSPDAARLAETVRRLVRPWMVLQDARGSAVVLDSMDGPGDAALSLKLLDMDANPLVLNISPRLLGGFTVWFDRPFVLAALYERERNAILYPKR